MAVTGQGKIILIVTVSCSVAGLSLMLVELVTVAIFGAFIITIAAAQMWHAEPLEVRVSQATQRITAGEPALISATFVGATHKRLTLNSMSITIGGQTRTHRLRGSHRLGAQATQLCFANVARGIYDLSNLESRVADVFGLFFKAKNLPCANRLIVHPKTIEISFKNSGGGWAQEDVQNPYYGRVDQELSAPRGYIPGDPIRLINWKATARTAAIQSNQFEMRTTQRSIVIIDTRCKSYAGLADFELAVGVVASLAVAELRTTGLVMISAEPKNQKQVRLFVGQNTIPLLDYLAGVNCKSELATTQNSFARLVNKLNSGHSYFFVSGESIAATEKQIITTKKVSFIECAESSQPHISHLGRGVTASCNTLESIVPLFRVWRQPTAQRR